MGTKEVLTLQFGHYSNYVGAHWWNIQESGFEYGSSTPSEINHDVLFREGLTGRSEVTFTPRLLLVDLKGSLKSLPESGTLYDAIPEPSKSGVNWDAQAVEIQTKAQEPRNPFQEDLENTQSAQEILKKDYNLDAEVKVWSDFLYTRYHPRTVNIVTEYEHASEHSQFEVFPLGSTLWKSESFQDDFSNKIRSYVEECDSLQGFHVVLDATNAFGGLASSCIEYMRDEYNRKSVLAFPVIPPYYSDYSFTTDEERYQSLLKDVVRMVNTMLCFDSLAEHASLFSPLCTSSKGWRQPGQPREFSHVSYNNTLPYHSSAILASALDTLTLKYRLRSSNFALSDLCTDLSVHSRKAVATGLCLPFSFNKGANLIDCLNNWEGPLTQSISPSCTLGTDTMLQMFTLRGISEDRLKPPSRLAEKYKDMAAYRCSSIKEMLSLYLSCNSFFSINNVTTVNKGLTVKTPYPKIFDARVGVDGNIIPEARPEHLAVQSVPALAGFQSGACVGDMLESLHTEVAKIKLGRFPQFINAGLEAEELNECLDRLVALKECYTEDYDL